MRILAVVTFRPFLCVTDRTYGTQVSTRHQVTLRLVLYQVRERQIARVRMMRMTSHHERESTDLRRPEQITVTCRLRTALRQTLMDRTEFVHVVRLVTSRTGVHEGEHTGDEQRRFMVSHGIRTGEDRTGLSVHTLAVGEEQTLSRRIVLVKDTTLANKTLVHQCAVSDLHTRSNDEICALDTATQTYRCCLVGVNCSVLETTHTGQFGIVTDPYILDRTAIQDPYVFTDETYFRSPLFCIGIDHLLQGMNHFRAVTIEGQDIRQTRT